MVDTTLKAYTAEDLISYKLQRFGLHVAKPKFDIAGTDLFAMLPFKADTGIVFKYCRIQCKYRSLLETSNNPINIPESYVKPDFIVFLHINDGDVTEDHLFCFFWEDFLSNSSPWHLEGGQFRFSITSNFKEALKRYIFSQSKVDQIKQRIETLSQVIANNSLFAELPLPCLELKLEIKQE